MRLEGKVAVISGGARGMGAAEARLLAKEGAKVVIGDIREEEGRQVEAEISEAGGEALFVELDVTKEGDWQRAVEATVSRFGKLNVLVNNAGISPPGTIEDTSVETWDQTMAVNVRGVFLGTKAAIPEMRKAGGGSIINISSFVGIVGSESSPPAYVASKGAVRSFTKAIAIQYAKDRIRCNSVHPGPIETPIFAEFLAANPTARENLLSATPPGGRFGQPKEVAFGVLYLASDESSFVTGAELAIDGGWIAQ